MHWKVYIIYQVNGGRKTLENPWQKSSSFTKLVQYCQKVNLFKNNKRIIFHNVCGFVHHIFLLPENEDCAPNQIRKLWNKICLLMFVNKTVFLEHIFFIRHLTLLLKSDEAFKFFTCHNMYFIFRLKCVALAQVGINEWEFPVCKTNYSHLSAV